MYECKQLKHKAAGHDGTLTDENEMLIFKPLVQQEVEFYKAIQGRLLKQSDSTGGDVPLHSWLPTFLGVLDESQQDGSPRDMTAFLEESQAPLKSTGKKYIVLENLLHGYSQPNIMDVKLGRVLYDEGASEEKRLRMTDVSESTTSGSLGFRICGMHLQWNKDCKRMDSRHYERFDNGYVFVNKMYGRDRTGNNIEDAFNLFFANDRLSAERTKQLKEMFLKRIQLLYNTLLDEEFRMISTSLLFIYEGDPNRWSKMNDRDTILPDDFIDQECDEGDGAPPENNHLSSLNLIDFAHTKLVPGKGYDENVVEAIENLMALFERFVV